jgi:hypothetical protein
MVAFFLGTMVSFGILNISLIHEKSDKLTVLLTMIAISHPYLFSYLGRWTWEAFSSLCSSIPGPSSDDHFWTPNPSSVENFILRWGVNVTALSSVSAVLLRMALYPEGRSITKNFTMMVLFLGYIPAMTESSINPNENTCSPVKPTCECLVGTIFP